MPSVDLGAGVLDDLRVLGPFGADEGGKLLGGVGGNFTDRLIRDPGPFRGHVVDFLQLPHWPIFNVADMCIDAAAVLIVLLTLRGIGLDGSRTHRVAEAERAATASGERDDA